MLKENQLRLPGKKVIIGQNREGWWAANPGKGIKTQDIDQFQIMIHKIPGKSKLLNLLKDLGYTKENIIEGFIGS